MFKIEKNVPMPEVGPNPKAPKYPWRQMEVGDSFVAPAASQRSICANAKITADRMGNGVQFTTQKQADGSVRVWRVK